MTMKAQELPAVRKILRRILKVRKAATIAAESTSRFATYRYLKSVLRAHNYFVEQKLLRYLIEIAPSVLHVPVRAGWHPLRLIIEATCIQPDLQMRSRWTRALEFALAEGVDPDELPQFLRANSGISGCADMASKVSRKSQRPTRSVRAGQRDRQKLDSTAL